MAANLITADQLYEFQQITDARISPCGERIVYTVQRVDRKSEKKYTNLWMVPTDGRKAKPFTTGDQSDTEPRWSPEGETIAFMSNRKDEEQPQIHLIAVAGGEARKLTDLKGEFGGIFWAPDGKSLLFSFRKKDADQIEREKDEERKKLGPSARHITRTFYRLDGHGYLPKERWHLWTVDAGSGRARQITKGDVHDEVNPSWSPDGKHIVYVTNLSEEPDHHPYADELCVIPSRGGKARKIDTPIGSKQQPAVSPDGAWIAYYADRGRGNWYQNTNLWVVPFDGKGRARNLTGKLDITTENITLGGLPATTKPVWSPDSARILFTVSRHGSASAWSIARSGRRDSVRAEIDTVGGNAPFSLDRDHGGIAWIHTGLHDPGQVQVADFEDRKPRRLTDQNPWLAKIRQGQVEEVWLRKGTVQGWIIKPPGFRASRRYPSILQIHGGPYMQYGATWMHEFQYLAANGYVVYYCNPRGSQGYGEEHAKAIDQDWGTAPHEDLMAFADHMARKPYIDPKRMGVTGGSYGGYMTNWIVGHTKRFAAAVTQRCVSNFISMWGSSDFNWVFQQECGDRPPWENLEEYWRQSPMKYVGSVKTPTLVIHSERDLRCDKEQGEQFYVALKHLGVDTELVLFPDESHGLSRGGRTDRRIARLEHILRWFDRYLK